MLTLRLPFAHPRSPSLALPTAALSTVMAKRNVTDEQLLAWAKPNDYKKGPHREKDNTRDNDWFIDKVKKNQDTLLDRYVLYDIQIFGRCWIRNLVKW